MADALSRPSPGGTGLQARPPAPPKGGRQSAKAGTAYRPGPSFSESVWDRPVAYKSPRKRSAKTRKYVNLIKAMIRNAVRRGDTARAVELVRHRDFVRLFDTIEQDIARTQVATLMLVKGEAALAFELAGPAADRSAAVVPKAHWIAGLGAWRMKNYRAALHHFALYAEGPGLSEWSQAAGAFWAGRAAMAVHHFDEAERWWTKAARYRLSFYGGLAGHLLGEDSAQTWFPVMPTANLAQRSDVLDQPALQRALALNQIGEHARAAKELERLVDRADPALAATLAPLAEHVNAPDIALKAGRRLVAENGLDYAAAIYPLPGWTPKGGYKVDRALLFALIRQESHFNPRAVSRSGARGLMQLMPATARFVARTAGLDADRKTLYRPEENMSLGQAYLRHLMDDNRIGNNLLYLMAAYNAGPGSLQRWLRRNPHDDPLYFIETLPARETRAYIKRVMSNLWSYRRRLHQPAPSLDDLVQGHWPRYVSIDDGNGATATAAAE